MSGERVLEDSELAKIDGAWKSDAGLARVELNWKTFERWCEQLGDRRDAVTSMLDAVGERVCTAPASTRLEYHNAFPGGFVDHSLRVLRVAIDIAGALKVKVSKESLIISSLFHDWGKAGTVEDDYYLPQTSDWHRKRGQMYTANPQIRMPNAQLGVFTLGQAGVKLSEEEYLAILLNDGPVVEANKPYSMKEPRIALVVHWADRWSCQLEKGRTSVLDPETT